MTLYSQPFEEGRKQLRGCKQHFTAIVFFQTCISELPPSKGPHVLRSVKKFHANELETHLPF